MRHQIPVFKFAIILWACVDFLQAQIVISQYYEGSSFNKFLEITNLGAEAIGSGTYYVCGFNNEAADNPEAQVPNSWGTACEAIPGLEAGQSIVFGHPDASYGGSIASDLILSRGAANFNGDDLVIITTNADESTPGAAWSARVDVVGNGENWGTDVSYVRDAGVSSPSSDYQSWQWASTSLDYVDNSAGGAAQLGRHWNSLLPVVLSAWEAVATPHGAKLYWKSESEINHAFYEIERLSPGSKDFVSIAKIHGRGTQDTAQYYEWVDPLAFRGMYYYRLKQTDIDGGVHFFTTLEVKALGIIDPAWVISPNPVQNSFTISPQIDIQGMLVIRNVEGRVVKHWNSLNVTQFQVEDLPSGIYHLEVIAEGIHFIQKLVKI